MDLDTTVGRSGGAKEADLSGPTRRAEEEAASGGFSDTERDDRREGREVEVMRAGEGGGGGGEGPTA